MPVLKPVNQKSLYNSAADLYSKIMNYEIEVDRAEVANNVLSNMNRTYALEVKRSSITGEPIRIIESKNFDNIKISE